MQTRVRFLTIPRYIEQNLSVPSFLTMKTLILSFNLTNTAFNEFLIILNKNIGFLFKFYHGLSELNHIFEFRSLFATAESLKSVEFPIHAVVRNSNSKHFHSMPNHFKLCLVQLQLHTVKNGKFEKEVIAFGKI